MTCHGRRRRPSRLRLSGAARPASRDLSATDMRCRRTRTQPGRSGARTADRRRRARSSVRKGFSVRLSNRLSVHCASDHTRGSSCAGRVGGNGAETRAARRAEARRRRPRHAGWSPVLRPLSSSSRYASIPSSAATLGRVTTRALSQDIRPCLSVG